MNLPQPPTSIIGRDAEVLYARALLRRHDVRLLTLTGAGGVGKTRLALEIARQVASDYADGVYFVPIATITDPALVLPELAAAVGLRNASTPETFAAELNERDILVVVDNFEQVNAAAPVLSAVLEAAPGLQLMVTSRALLRVSGEHQLQVAPLAAPVPARLPSLAELAVIPAVELFTTRAQAATGTFALTEDNAVDVAQICSRLDGLPLAIELAAARLRHLPLSALIQRLDRPLDVLVGGPRDAPARLRTLRDGLAWSYSLLPPMEQTLFRRLAVFSGGFSIDLAEEIVSDGPAEAGDMLDGIAALIDSSLLVQLVGTSPPRYGMLETVREFAEETLRASGEQETLQDRHLHAMLTMAEAANDALEGPERSTWEQRLRVEQENLRAAIQRAIARQQGELALRLSTELWDYWTSHDARAEGRRWLEQSVALANNAPARQRSRAYHILGNLALSNFDLGPARRHYADALAIWQESGSPDDVAMGELGLGVVARYLGAYAEGLAHFDRVRDVWAGLDDRAGLAIVEHSAGSLLSEAGHPEESRELLTLALTLRREVAEPYGVAYTQTALAIAERWAGHLTAAATSASDALSAFQDLESKEGQILATLVLAFLATDTGRDDEAIALLQGPLVTMPGHLSVKASIEALEAVAGILLRRSLADAAARLLSAATTARATRSLVAPIPERPNLDALRAAIATTLGVRAFSTSWSEGARLPLVHAIAEAGRIIDDPLHAASGKAPFDLTRRELEVLSLLAEHLSDREIADRLFLSPRTIERHVSNILLKMEAPNRRLAAAQAVRERLVASRP